MGRTFVLGARCVLVVALLLCAAPAGAAPIPGSGAQGIIGELAHFSGTLGAGESVDPFYQLFGSAEVQANLRLYVPLSAGDAAVDVAVTDGSGAPAFTGSGWNGETLWASATLTPGINTFRVTNPGTSRIAYDLWVYETGPAPLSWTGASRGGNTSWRSEITLEFPEAGVYRFDAGVTSGRYQFLVDDNYVQKTVEAADSTSYYVAAGSHTLLILPESSAAVTAWSLSVAGPNASTDTLPYGRAGGKLGGPGNSFSEEWLPLDLASAAEVNFRLTLTGGPGDALDAEVYDGLAPGAGNSAVRAYGGETLWWSSSLLAGISRVRLAAAPGNAGPLSYDLAIIPVGAVPGEWSGASSGGGGQSALRFTADQAGLYDFTYSAGPGRYEFLVDGSTRIQKMIEADGTVRYYLGQGTHDLIILQDPASTITEWSLAIGPAGIPTDSLPYQKEGGSLGGSENTFVEEWLPLDLPAATAANFRLSLDGDLADSAVVSLQYGANGAPVFVSPVVHGGETIWWTADLAAGLNELQFLALASNLGPLSYHLAVTPVSGVFVGQPYSWSGLSSGGGGRPAIRLRVPVAGVYHVALDMPAGFANVHIGGPATAQVRQGEARSEFNVPLTAGDYTFEVWQSAAYITTTWTVTVSARDVPAPAVASVDPPRIDNSTRVLLTLRGANFQPGARATAGMADLGPVLYAGSDTVQVWTPVGLRPGVLDLTVTNLDGKSASLPAGLTVLQGEFRVYAPLALQ